ncbi:MAG: response regulator transcription factor [Saprospiraceae bacterium]|nr:response regulator transcription factor [Saprospiraceae bacterium]
MIGILLCDDHPLVIEGLKLIIQSHDQMEIIGSVHNGQEAIDFLSEHEVDILLMDINMPVLNGIEACKIIQKEHQEVKVIMLSMLDDLHITKKLIEYGAKAYILKNASKDEIIQSILGVAEGRVLFDQEMLLKIIDLKNSKNRKIEKSLFPKLSRREKEILSLIVQEHTTGEIAEKLFISFGTVETHRRNMLNKLGLRNTAGLVRMAMEYNLLEE